MIFASAAPQPAAVAETPQADHLNSQGIAHVNQGKLDDALRLFRQALQLRPHGTDIHNNLGVAYAKLGRFAEAAGCFSRVLQDKPESVEGHSNLGLAYLEEGRGAEAATHFRRVLELSPESTEGYLNLGVALLQLGQPEAAARQYEQALERNPAYAEAHTNLARALLCLGQFERGWPEYEWRWQCRDNAPPRTLPQPRWDGSPLNGRTILLHAEQGLGDTIHFIRYAAVLQRLGGRVVFECPKPLLGLLARTPGIAELIGQGGALPAFDVHAPLLSVPGLVGTRLENIPAAAPYIHPNPKLVERWRDELRPVPGFKVGIAWQGNPHYRGDRHRSVPLRCFAPLARVPGVQLFSLQKGHGLHQLGEAADSFLVHDLGCRLDDASGTFMDTAAVMKNLDLIITSDTAIPHLAGALGVPAWMATPFSPDWRWLREGEHCPWYPSLRLFRQPRFGDWESVFARMAGELEQQVRRRPVGAPSARAATGAATHHQQGVALVKDGQLEEAIPHLERAVWLDPALVEASHNLGVAWARLGHLDRAIPRFKDVLRHKPDAGDAHGNLGLALLRQGKASQAIVHFERVLQARPDASDIHHHVGNAYRELQQFDEAVAAYRRAVQYQPDLAEAYQDLGIALGHQEKHGEAIAAYEEALRIRPDFPEAHNNLGILLEEEGKLDEAITHFRESLRLNPHSSETHSNLGVALSSQGKLEEAVVSYREALRLRPDSPEAHNNLGNTLRNLGLLDEAVTHFQEAIRVKPDYSEAYNNVGIVLVHQGKMDEGMACYDRALELKPDYADAHLNRSLAWLAIGDFERGWHEYEWRWRGKRLLPPRSFPQPRWAGEPLDGKSILLYPEQGLGDSIQFVRYAALVKARGGRVIFECPKPLFRLLARTPGIDVLIEQGQPVPPFDVQAPLLSLPGLLGTQLDNVPAQVPYLHPDPDLLKSWRQELAEAPGFKIGIAWQGNPQYRGDRHRSVPLRYFAAIARLPGVQLFSLQKGHGTQQLAETAEQFAVHDLSRRLDEAAGPFMDTAAVMRVLDLVITSDTAIPHLAGALGVPVWMATPFAADWRWLRAGERCPWYPTMRMFRQPRFGDWETVFAQIAEELQKRLASLPGGGKLAALAVEAEAEHQRGVALVKDGRVEQAIAHLERAVWLKPDLIEALHNLGVAFARLGRLDDAVPRFKEVLRLRPDSVEAHGNLGLAYLKHGKPLEAVQQYQQVIRQQPQSAEAYNHLGVALADLSRHEEAADAYQYALRLKPDYADAQNNYGNLLRHQGKQEEALGWYRQAIRNNPQEPEIANNLGIALSQLGDWPEAIRHFRLTLQLKPDHAEAYNNLGVLYQDTGSLDEAVAQFHQVLGLQPDNAGAHKNLGLAWLRQGKFEQGWPEYEWRWRCKDRPARQFSQPRWDGSPLDGKTILLHAEQGLGDTIQFVRFAALVKARGARVLLESPRPLRALLARCPGVDYLFEQGSPLPAFDVHAPLLSLPYILRTTLADVPAPTAYLSADPDRVAHWQRLLSHVGGFRVGIAWQGNPNYGGDKHRSLPVRHFAALAAIPGVQLVSLQKGAGTEQLGAAADRFFVVDLGRQLDEGRGAFTDTAAVMKNLDLVITSDTAIPHLAGALGVPVWVAVPFTADWRWLLDRDDSPWYPTMRLFRQRQLGNWETVFAALAQELTAMLSASAGRHAVAVEIAPGELLDKITILQIKRERLTDAAKLRNVECELTALIQARDRALPASAELDRLTAELKAVNEALWRIEDDIRDCERRQDFGPAFTELARSVYHQNDRRAALKRQLNDLLGSRFVEEKSYTDYRRPDGAPQA